MAVGTRKNPAYDISPGASSQAVQGQRTAETLQAVSTLQLSTIIIMDLIYDDLESLTQ